MNQFCFRLQPKLSKTIIDRESKQLQFFENGVLQVQRRDFASLAAVVV